MLDFLPIKIKNLYGNDFLSCYYACCRKCWTKISELGLTNALYLGLAINVVLWNTVGKKYVGMY